MGLATWAWIALQIATPAPPAQAHLKQAAACRENRDYPCAIAELRQALKLRPDSRDAHSALGEILFAQGFAREALPHLETAGNTYSQGLALLELNRLPEALGKLLAVKATRPDDPEVLFHLGQGCGNLMQQAFNRLLRLHPESPQARELRAGAHPAVTPDLGKVLPEYAQRADGPEVLLRLGQAAANLMQQSFTRLGRLYPESAPAAELQARNYLGQGRGELAEPLFRKALTKNPNLPGIHLALGRILLEAQGDLDGAEKEFRAEVQLRPGDAEAAWRLGSILAKSGKSKEALAELQRADRLKPDMLETLMDLGKAYSTEGRVDEAAKTFRRIIAIEDNDELAAAAHLQLSQICRKLGMVAEADQHLRRFRELNRK